MKKKILLLCSLLSITLVGCGSDISAPSFGTSYKGDTNYITYDYDSSSYEDSYVSSDEYEEYNGMEYSNQIATDYQAAQENRKLIYRYHIGLEPFEGMTAKVDELTNKYYGWYDNVDQYSYDWRDTWTWEIRVPTEYAENFISDLKSTQGTDEFKSYSVDIDDQTMNYYDIDGRLQNYKAYIKQLQLLEEQAYDVEDLISIQREISQTQYQIDSLQGSLNKIDNKVTYCSINISAELNHYESATFGERFGQSFEESSERIIEALTGIPAFIVGLIIYAIGGFLVLLVSLNVIKIVLAIIRKIWRVGKVKDAVKNVKEVIVDEKENK